VPDRDFRRAWGRGLSLAGMALLALGLTGCSPYPFSPIKPVGLVARQDDNLYEIVSIIAYCVFAIVGGLIIYAAFRFRRPRNRAYEEPRQVFGNTSLELTWTFIPILIVGLLFALAVQTLQATSVPDKIPNDAVVINVVGHQWYWEYNYLSDRGVTIKGVDYNQGPRSCTQYAGGYDCLNDGMHIPLNRRVVLRITGNDVQHGWWVPALAGKNEAIPGHINKQQFVADKVGTYYAVCSYFCGIYHYDMVAYVVVQTEADFHRWLSRVSAANPAPAAASTPAPAATAQAAHPAPAATAKAANPAPVASAPVGVPAPAQTSGKVVSFSADMEGLFKAHCASCHLNGVALGNLNLSNYQGLVTGGNVVAGSIFKAGDHANSVLYQIVQANPPWPGGNRMPLGGPYLDATQIQTIATWIDQGAKNN